MAGAVEALVVQATPRGRGQTAMRDAEPLVFVQARPSLSSNGLNGRAKRA